MGAGHRRTAPECGFSHRVLTILNESNVDYELLNVLDEEHNPGLREAVKQYRYSVLYHRVLYSWHVLCGASAKQGECSVSSYCTVEKGHSTVQHGTQGTLLLGPVAMHTAST